MTQKGSPAIGGQAVLDPTTSRMIGETVTRALKQQEYYHYRAGLLWGGKCEITGAARELVRERLRAFPDVCLKAQDAEGSMKVVLDFEIRTIKNALTGISDDSYYQIVPDLYLHKMTMREIGRRTNCDTVTVWRNERRLLDRLALLIYGVSAWWRHPPEDLALFSTDTE